MTDVRRLGPGRHALHLYLSARTPENASSLSTRVRLHTVAPATWTGLHGSASPAIQRCPGEGENFSCSGLETGLLYVHRSTYRKASCVRGTGCCLPQDSHRPSEISVGKKGEQKTGQGFLSLFLYRPTPPLHLGSSRFFCSCVLSLFELFCPRAFTPCTASWIERAR